MRYARQTESGERVASRTRRTVDRTGARKRAFLKLNVAAREATRGIARARQGKGARRGHCTSSRSSSAWRGRHDRRGRGSGHGGLGLSDRGLRRWRWHVRRRRGGGCIVVFRASADEQGQKREGDEGLAKHRVLISAPRWAPVRNVVEHTFSAGRARGEVVTPRLWTSWAALLGSLRQCSIRPCQRRTLDPPWRGRTDRRILRS